MIQTVLFSFIYCRVRFKIRNAVYENIKKKCEVLLGRATAIVPNCCSAVSTFINFAVDKLSFTGAFVPMKPLLTSCHQCSVKTLSERFCQNTRVGFFFCTCEFQFPQFKAGCVHTFQRICLVKNRDKLTQQLGLLMWGPQNH